MENIGGGMAATFLFHGTLGSVRATGLSTVDNPMTQQRKRCPTYRDFLMVLQRPLILIAFDSMLAVIIFTDNYQCILKNETL